MFPDKETSRNGVVTSPFLIIKPSAALNWNIPFPVSTCPPLEP